jgi:ArsR family transcriptional regulator
VPHTLQGFKAELFKALAHPARIRILEHLRSGERTVSELQALLDLESSTVSQQLALLRARSIVEGRKQGTSVYYRVPDPLIFELLDVARQIFANHVVGLQAMADEQPGVPGQVGGDARGGDDQISPADLVVVTPADGADGAERS